MRIRTPSRIHMTLIDLNGSLGRIDGGVGFALDFPTVHIKCKEDDVVLVEGGINRERFEKVARKLSSIFGYGMKIDVLSDYESHVGLGSGTQISLAVAKAFNEIYDLGLSVRDMAEITGRGGTSGIGVAVFEMGGFILDGGHSRKDKPEFLPSSASKAKPPKVLARYDLPNWKVLLAIPNLKGFYGLKEIDLFKKFCPIPLEDVRKLSHVILMKLLPSVVEQDLDEFCNSIRIIQSLGFKKVEIDRYGDLIWSLIRSADFPIGMSSTGPTLYMVTDTDTSSIKRDIEGYFKERGFDAKIYKTRPRNVGVEVFYS